MKPLGIKTKRAAGVERLLSPSQGQETAPPARDPADAFCEHFFRCFFCSVGDCVAGDYFCLIGRELMVDMLDDRYEKERAHAE